MDEISQTNIYFLRYSINILEWVCQNLSSSIIMIAQQLSGELVVSDITSKVRQGENPVKLNF